MDKYKIYDIENGLSQLKVGLYNSIHDFMLSADSKLELGEHIPVSLVVEILNNMEYSLSPDSSFEVSDWEQDFFKLIFSKDDNELELWGNWFCGNINIEKII